MSHQKGLHSGAVWHKCDFQCHTPRDRGWIGSEVLPGGSLNAEDARKEWAEKFVAAALDAGLSAVAITDHHDICLASYVQQAAIRAGEVLVVFSGVEITCSDNAQCLAIFDPSCGSDIIKILLAKAGRIVHSDSDEPKTCLIEHAGSTVAELFDHVASEPVLRTHCVLIPHFSTIDAHKSLNQLGHHPRFADLPCDGVYIERPFAELDKVTTDKIHGLVSGWGTRRRAILATGDNRSATWDKLGAQALCRLVEGSRVQDAENQCSQWVQRTLAGATDPAAAWQGICDGIIKLYETKIALGSPSQPGSSLVQALDALFFGGEGRLTTQQKHRIYQNLSDATVGAVLSAVPKDAIVLSYLEEGRALDFQKASPGQQASALLELLLHQSAGTLIIDQPEDDLDNRIMMKIVHLIRTSKSRRQLIFTTHNPNIVVNGDADKVVVLKTSEPFDGSERNSARIELDVDGAIETPAIRAAVTRIMEGGEEAFDLRRRKYRFDLLH